MREREREREEGGKNRKRKEVIERGKQGGSGN